MDELANTVDDNLPDVPIPGMPDDEAAGVPDDELVGTIDEIEQAYQKALSAMGDVPWPVEPETLSSAADSESGDSAPADSEAADAEPAISRNVLRPDAGHSPASPSFSVDLRLGAATEIPRDPLPESGPRVTPAQVIEAVLFVGGMPLSATKIGSLLRGVVENNAVERTIDELNRQYLAEGRPYEIRLRDGGYRLELRPEHEKLRNRVYGAGPREVRLSQDALEVLALVAYRQPISQAQIEAHGKQNAGNLLRQLLRRDLVALERGEQDRKNVQYVTTDRFLSVFGLGSLSELPEPEDLTRR